jgi:hypothetical protein
MSTVSFFNLRVDSSFICFLIGIADPAGFGLVEFAAVVADPLE